MDNVFRWESCFELGSKVTRTKSGLNVTINLMSDYQTNLLQIPLFWFSKEPLIKWLYRSKGESVWLIELSNLKPTVRPQVYEDM